MRFRWLCPVFLLPLFFVFVFPVTATALEAKESKVVSDVIDQIHDQIQKGENPEKLFSLPITGTADNEPHIGWLDPHKWVPAGNEEKISHYIGSVGFVKLKAPYFRVYHAAISYVDEPKFIPGILSTKVLNRVSQEKGKERVLLEREREMPLALRALMIKSSRYQISNEMTSKKNDWLLIRIKLAHSEKREKRLMKVIEALEYYKNLGGGKTLYLTAGFALPNTGFLSVQKAEKPPKLLKPFGTAALDVLDKVVSKLDVRNQIYRTITESILDGTYQNMIAITQLTTDPRWKDKWAHQLTKEESGQIVKENKSFLETAKKNGWVVYPS